MTWPLVGRAAERSRILAVLRGHARARVVLRGPAGIGKTALLHEIVADLAERGVRPVQVPGTDVDDLPFSAVAHLLPDEAVGASQLAMLRGAFRTVAARAASPAGVLVVDDAHRLDAGSAAVVHRAVSLAQVRVVATVREGSTLPEAIERLVRMPDVVVVDVGALDGDDAATLLEHALGDAVATRTVRRLLRLSEGNPLWLRELTDGAVRRGGLRRDGTMWRLDDAPLPARSLPTAIRAAVEELEAPVRDVVAAVALSDVIGVRVLEAMFDDDALVDAEARGMLAAVHDDRRVQVRLAHALHGDAVLADLPPVRARRLRLRLADAVEATGRRRRQDLLRVARWRLEAGDRTDPLLLTDAAYAAGGGGAHELAERFARAAVDAGAGFSARMALGEALQRTGRTAAAVDALRGAVVAAATPEQQVRAHALLADVLFWWQRPQAAERELRAADRVAVASADRHRIAVQRALFATGGGDLNGAARAAAEALEEPSISPRVRSDALFVVMSAAPPCGRPRWAIEVMRKAREASMGPADVEYGYALDIVLPHLAGAHWWAWQLDAAEATLVEAGRVVTDNAQVPLWCGWVGGLVELARGRPTVAVGVFEHTVGQFAHVFPDPDSAGDLCSTVWSTLAHAAALTGDHDRARHALNVAEAQWPRELFDVHRVVARAWVPAARGDLTLARRRAADGAEQARALGVRLVEARLLHDLVRFGDPSSAVERLDELATVVDAPQPAIYGVHARGLADGDPAVLEQAAVAFERAGCLLEAADVHVQRAMLLDERSSAGGPASAWMSAQRLATRCGNPATPALAQLAAPLLTAREREVAALAASGLSDREIGGRLGISVRTVGSHLHRGYAKLGIDGRRGLRDVITWGHRP